MKLSGPYSTDPLGAKIYGTGPHGPMTVLDVRGWGYLTGKGHGALGLGAIEANNEQFAFANFVVDALNKASEDVNAPNQ